MIDFTSSSYLGIRHAHGELRPWTQLTTGVPAALAEAAVAGRAARRLAELLRLPAAVLSPSTLHAAHDVFEALVQTPSAFLVDRAAYPVLGYGLSQAAHRRVHVFDFAHHDVEQLRKLARSARQSGLRPVAITDGICACCWRPGPLAAYAQVMSETDGVLVIDDTQAVGLLGRKPSSHQAWGLDGSGTLAHLGVAPASVLVVSSLAKAFGVPVAIVSGTSGLVEAVKRYGVTRLHCSPPSVAHISAVENALDINARRGAALRDALIGLLRRFQQGLSALGLYSRQPLFPVQAAAVPGKRRSREVDMLLRRAGVRCLVTESRETREVTLEFVFTCRHTFSDVDRAIDALASLGPVRRVPKQEHG